MGIACKAKDKMPLPDNLLKKEDTSPRQSFEEGTSLLGECFASVLYVAKLDKV